MARREPYVRRSAAQWGIHVMVVASVLAAGYIGTAQTLAYAMQSNPARAHALAPWDGRITAGLARQQSGPEATAADRTAADQLARSALMREPTAVAAASTLGLNALIRGNTAHARRLLAYSQAMSRRDLPTQLWAVEDAVSRGDVAGAVQHYDIALRTSRNAPDLLYPILASAISERPVLTALASTLAQGPIWGSSFVNYVAGNGPDPQATATFYLALRRAGVPVASEANAVVTSALILADHWSDAWSYYAVIHPGVDRSRSRDPRFRAQQGIASPFDWTVVDAPGIVTSVQSGDRGGIFDFSASPGTGGPLLRQVQVLPPGDYQLAGHSAGIDQPEDSRPYWTLSCRNGQEFGRVNLPNSRQQGGRFTGLLRVPATCPVQVLALNARPSNALAGTTGQIDAVQLEPVR